MALVAAKSAAKFWNPLDVATSLAPVRGLDSFPPQTSRGPPSTKLATSALGVGSHSAPSGQVRTAYTENLRQGVISGELRYREYDKEVAEGKDTVKMLVAENPRGRDPAA